MKKVLLALFLSVLFCSCAVFFAACGDNRDAQIVAVYDLYAQSVTESGETPLSYDEWIKSIKGADGKNGIDGKNGVSILKVEKTSTDGLVDTYTITFSDGKTTTFTVSNGAQGIQGEQGQQGVQGEKGDTGATGQDGKNGITPQLRINEKTNYWEVSYDDGETWISLGVKATGAAGTNGSNGSNGENGITPQLRINSSTNYWEVSYNNGVTWQSLGVKATGAAGANGSNGSNGSDGKSAYQLYKEKYGYDGSEEEWLFDLVNGNLALKQTYIVTFDSDGGTAIETQPVLDGKKATKPANPEKEGCVFNGWYVGDEEWNFLYCVVTENTTLKAKWIQVEYGANVGDKDDIGVDLDDEKITLTAMHRAGYTWLGWYVGDEKVSSGNSYSVTFNQSEIGRSYIAKFAQVSTRQNVADAGTITQLNGKYFYGDVITVSATVNSGYVFKGWYKNDEKASADEELDLDIIFGEENETYTATYMANPVTVTKNISAAGSVSKESTGIVGADYTVTATTNAGYTWLGWYNGANKVSIGESLTYTFTLTESPVTLTAKWAEYKVTLSKNYNKAGTVSGDGSKTAGSSVTVRVTNEYKEYFTFDGWYNGSSKVSSSQNYTFEMPGGNISLTAKWNLKDAVQAITTASELNLIDGTKTYILLNDIDLSGVTFTSKTISASGVLDGLGYRIINVKNNLFSQNIGTIKNLVIETVKSSIETTVPFVSTNNNVIKNCGVIHNSDYSSSSGGYGFVFSNYGQILNCYAKGSAKSIKVGFLYNNYGTIKNCYSELDVSWQVSVSGGGTLSCYGFNTYNGGNIDCCYYTGKVTSEATDGNRSARAYGFATSTNGSITNCFFAGDLYAFSTSYSVSSAAKCAFYKENSPDGTTTNCYTCVTISQVWENGIITSRDNFYNKSFVTSTVKFKEYGNGTVDNGYVWVFEENKLPKLYWE